MAGLFCMMSIMLHAQDATLFKGWDKAVTAGANTAADAGYMTEEEKGVVLLTNLARIDGPLFVETVFARWLEHEKSTDYTRSLVRELKKTSGLTPLVPQRDLYDIARGHAIKSGKRGQTGHQRFEKRFKPVMGKYSRVAENCAYGYDKALDIVIGLLVDEGIRDLGHRKNMLNKDLNSIGVSIQPHKNYRYNCVMDFGRQ